MYHDTSSDQQHSQHSTMKTRKAARKTPTGITCDPKCKTHCNDSFLRDVSETRSRVAGLEQQQTVMRQQLDSSERKNVSLERTVMRHERIFDNVLQLLLRLNTVEGFVPYFEVLDALRPSSEPHTIPAALHSQVHAQKRHTAGR